MVGSVWPQLKLLAAGGALPSAPVRYMVEYSCAGGIELRAQVLRVLQSEVASRAEEPLAHVLLRAQVAHRARTARLWEARARAHTPTAHTDVRARTSNRLSKSATAFAWNDCVPTRCSSRAATAASWHSYSLGAALWIGDGVA